MTCAPPVQLVPENARAGKGGFPLKVGAARTQAIWVEVYIRRDLPAGTYRGEVVIAADGRTTSLGVSLDVLGFTLPDENSLRFMATFPTAGSYRLFLQFKTTDGRLHTAAFTQEVTR